mgnify:CR=1 FL=1
MTRAVIITGAAGGIGTALCGRMRKDGYITIGIDRVPAPAADISLQFDLRESEPLSEVGHQLARDYELKAVVHNAAVQPIAGAGETSLAEWSETWRVNVIAVDVLVSTTRNRLVANEGSVVVVGSVHGRATTGGITAYATTKAAIAAAQARVDSAKLDLSRTTIASPMAGVVTDKNVQIGERVDPGRKLMVIVPLNSVYVDANFKEVQLRKVLPGQKVELVSDLYGDKIKYHGTVTGLSGGTGSAFSLIPAQNATGNWIKVVQRVPVRIALNEDDVKAHPLRVGLSMRVKIDLNSGQKQAS